MRRTGEVGWILFLAGLPFAPFLDRRLDLWHGQAQWAIGWVGILWLWSIEQPAVHRMNKSFLAWSLYGFGFFFVSLWQGVAVAKAYPILMLIACSHFLCIIFFYQAALAFWTPAFLESLCRWVARASACMVVYGFLQICQADPWLKNFDHDQAKNGLHSLLIGTLGNPDHLGAYFAMTLPLVWLYRRFWRWRIILAGQVVLLGWLAIGSQVIGGLVAALAVLLWSVWRRSPRLAYGFGGFLCCIGGILLWKHPGVIDSNGRFAAWAAFWPLSAQHIAFGTGPGAVLALSQTVTDAAIKGWGHCHNEYLQVLLEQGLIGLGLVAWGIAATIQRARQLPQTPLVLALSGTGIAFLVNSFYNFPAHLWVLSSLGLLAYCGLWTLDTSC